MTQPDFDGEEDQTTSAPPNASVRARRHSFTEWLLISLVVLYAGALLLGPLLAIAWGAMSQGLAIFLQEISTDKALSALKLTLMMGAGATAINTVFGLCIAF